MTRQLWRQSHRFHPPIHIWADSILTGEGEVNIGSNLSLIFTGMERHNFQQRDKLERSSNLKFDKLEASLILRNRNCDHRRIRERETLNKLNLKDTHKTSGDTPRRHQKCLMNHFHLRRHIFSLSPSDCCTTSHQKWSQSTMFPYPIPSLVPSTQSKLISAINIHFATKSNGQLSLFYLDSRQYWPWNPFFLLTDLSLLCLMVYQVQS